jgi:hypothetical protein
MTKSEPIKLHPTRVTHLVSKQKGWALEFNGNHDEPAYWVEWADGTGENWFSVESVERGWQP